MRTMLVIFALLFVVGCGRPRQQDKSTIIRQTERQTVKQDQRSVARGQKKVADAVKVFPKIELPLLNMDAENWQKNRTQALEALGELRNDLKDIGDIFQDIGDACLERLSQIQEAEKADHEKDVLIQSLQNDKQELQVKLNNKVWDDKIKQLLYIMAGLCAIGALVLGIAGAVMKKSAFFVDAGIFLLAFACCIAGIRFYEQIAIFGGLLLLTAFTLALYHVYEEFHTTNRALETAVATVNVVKSNLDPAKAQEIMTTQVAPLQAAAGVTDKIAAVRSKVEGASNASA